MGKKIDELDKVITLMEKTNRLNVTGVIDLDTKTAILDTCKQTVQEILKPVMPAPAQSDVDIKIAPTISETYDASDVPDKEKPKKGHVKTRH